MAKDKSFEQERCNNITRRRRNRGRIPVHLLSIIIVGNTGGTEEDINSRISK